MHSWGGEEGGRERHFSFFLLFVFGIGLWVSVNNFEGVHSRALGTKMPFLLILGVVEGREFLLTPIFQVPPPQRRPRQGPGPSPGLRPGPRTETKTGWRDRDRDRDRDQERD